MRMLIVILSIFIVGCASAPTQKEIANADYGKYQSLDDCKRIAEKIIRGELKDPNSAIFRHGSCYEGYWGNVPVLGMEAVFGYVQKGTVNAKNSYGGYTGARSYTVLIRNGFVARYCMSDNDGLCMPIEYFNP